MDTIYVALAVFGIAILGGVYLLSLIMRDKETPKLVSAVHGLFAVTGLILLIVYCARHQPGPGLSLGIFVVAALGGIVLLHKELTVKKVPKWLGILHGVVALAGYIMLVVYTVQSA